MPYFFGLGLHIIVALLCAIHVVRTGQPMYWLIILFMFPLLGSVVYIVAVYLPNTRLDRGARRAVTLAAKVIDPNREVREARAAFDEAPTAQNQMRLAAALLEQGAAAESAKLYEGCLQGPFASDLEIRYGAARAFIECGRFQDALGHLEAIRATKKEFRAESISLLLGRTYGGLGRDVEARAEFESAIATYGTFEARAECAIWALGKGDRATADPLLAEVDKIASRWNSANRELNARVMRRLAAARGAAKTG
jgi:hypothetical protein